MTPREPVEKPGMFLGIRDALKFIALILGAWIFWGIIAWAVWWLVEKF